MPEKNDKKAYKGFRGTIRAALTHHPDKFSKEACKKSTTERKKSGKLCPYAIFTAKKEKGAKAHYKELPHTTEGSPEKKEKYKNEAVLSFKEYVEQRDILEEAKKKKKMGVSAGMLNAQMFMP